MGIEEGVIRRGRNMLTQEPIAYLNRGKGKHAYLHRSIDVKFIFDSVLDCKTVRIFAYSSTREQSNKKSGTRLKTESETGRARLARFLRARPTPRFTDFFTDFEKKSDCFAV